MELVRHRLADWPAEHDHGRLARFRTERWHEVVTGGLAVGVTSANTIVN